MQTEQAIISNKPLNKAFLKVKPNRSQIEEFKENLAELPRSAKDNESEEFHGTSF